MFKWHCTHFPEVPVSNKQSTQSCYCYVIAVKWFSLLNLPFIGCYILVNVYSNYGLFTICVIIVLYGYYSEEWEICFMQLCLLWEEPWLIYIKVSYFKTVKKSTVICNRNHVSLRLWTSAGKLRRWAGQPGKWAGHCILHPHSQRTYLHCVDFLYSCWE